jgi:hypothetical protein
MNKQDQQAKVKTTAQNAIIRRDDLGEFTTS